MIIFLPLGSHPEVKTPLKGVISLTCSANDIEFLTRVAGTNQCLRTRGEVDP